MGQNDQEAIAAVLAGDTDAYAGLVQRHAPSLFRVACRITGNEADAEDVVQDALLRGYRKLEGFEARANFGTWLYRIAVRCALDKVKARRGEDTSRVADDADPELQEIQLADRAPGPEQLLLSSEIGILRHAAMQSLTATERTAFVLRHLEDCSTEQIAAVLGIAPNAAKQAVFRAVHKLRPRLAALRVAI